MIQDSNEEEDRRIKFKGLGSRYSTATHSVVSTRDRELLIFGGRLFS